MFKSEVQYKVNEGQNMIYENASNMKKSAIQLNPLPFPVILCNKMHSNIMRFLNKVKSIFFNIFICKIVDINYH